MLDLYETLERLLNVCFLAWQFSHQPMDIIIKVDIITELLKRETVPTSQNWNYGKIAHFAFPVTLNEYYLNIARLNNGQFPRHSLDIITILFKQKIYDFIRQMSTLFLICDIYIFMFYILIHLSSTNLSRKE